MSARLLAVASVCAVLSGGLSAGCASNVPVIIDFPSPASAVISSNADIVMVPIDENTLDICPQLLGTPTLDGIEIEGVPICSLRSGTALPDPGGAVAVVVRVLDDRATVILEGCEVADVHPGRGEIRVELFPTAAYSATLARLGPPAGGIDLVCGGGT